MVCGDGHPVPASVGRRQGLCRHHVPVGHRQSQPCWHDAQYQPRRTGMGNYQVSRLIRFEVAPGHQTSILRDNIGDGTLTDNRAGLAVFRIAYDDGSKGILAVSCHLNGNPPSQADAAPASIFEGITASKGFVDYWNRVAPAGSPGTANANRTLFHILSGD